MLSCKDVTHLLSQSQDRRLSWAERFGVRLHLAYCRGCRRFARHLEFLRTAAGRLRRESAAWRLSSDARDRIKRRLGKDR